MNRHIPALMAMVMTVAVLCAILGNFFRDYTALAEEKCIYLTFDDGPSDRVTPKVLDVLKRQNVPATFFIIGCQSETREKILRRAAGEGHTLAVHSYTHKYGEIYSSAEALLKDVEKCNGVIKKITGKKSRVYRFPGGSFNLSEKLKTAIKKAGYKYVDWNASFCDSEYRRATSDELYNYAIKTVSNPQKIIMLAHDSTDKINTPAALEKVIIHFKKAGYVFKKF